MEYLLFSIGPLILPSILYHTFWEMTLALAPSSLFHFICGVFFSIPLLSSEHFGLINGVTSLASRVGHYLPLFRSFSCLFWYLLSMLTVFLVIFAYSFRTVTSKVGWKLFKWGWAWHLGLHWWASSPAVRLEIIPNSAFLFCPLVSGGGMYAGNQHSGSLLGIEDRSRGKSSQFHSLSFLSGPHLLPSCAWPLWTGSCPGSVSPEGKLQASAGAGKGPGSGCVGQGLYSPSDRCIDSLPQPYHLPLLSEIPTPSIPEFS